METNVERTRRALALLREARSLLVKAGADKAAEKTRLAISSCDGAVRNAEGHETRERYASGRWAQDMEG